MERTGRPVAIYSSFPDARAAAALLPDELGVFPLPMDPTDLKPLLAGDDEVDGDDAEGDDAD